VADPRFYKVAGPFSLSDLAGICGAKIGGGGDPATTYAGVAPLDRAGSKQVSFLDNKRYAGQFRVSAAGACIVAPKYAEQAPKGMALLITSKPYRAYALAAQAFYPAPAPRPGRHPSAVVDPSARIGEGTEIGAGVAIAAGAEIGLGCRIGANAAIGEGVIVGDGTEIGANVTLSHCLIGRNCQIHPGVCIGNRGFGFTLDPEGYLDVPQLGRVIVEDGVEVGANSTIDRGSGPDTRIGAGSKIDNLVQIAHNVRVGEHCVLASQVGISGSVRIGDGCIFGGRSGAADNLTIGNGVRLAGGVAVATHDIPDGMAVSGFPAQEHRKELREQASLRRLPALARQLKDLLARVERLESTANHNERR